MQNVVPTGSRVSVDVTETLRRLFRGPCFPRRIKKNIGEARMDFNIPKDIADYLGELDRFIEREIKPLENKNDNIRFFDHRREAARTDWDRGGLPNEEW